MAFLPDTNVWISLPRTIGPNDLKIAAIVRTHGLILVSADREFSRVPALQVEDWA
jgi:predicted nucleic acid-binding protein